MMDCRPKEQEIYVRICKVVEITKDNLVRMAKNNLHIYRLSSYRFGLVGYIFYVKQFARTLKSLEMDLQRMIYKRDPLFHEHRRPHTDSFCSDSLRLDWFSLASHTNTNTNTNTNTITDSTIKVYT